MKIEPAGFDRAIKDLVWPSMRGLGFTDFSKRTSWRHHEDRVDILNIQTLYQHSYEFKERDRYSFALNLGCHMRIPSPWGAEPKTSKSGKLCPLESQAHFRGRLRRSLRRPLFKDRFIWFVRDDGSNLQACLLDAAKSATESGEPWFAQFSSPDKCMAILEAREEEMDVLWGFGNRPSPVRHYLIGCLAMRMGSMPLAARHLEEASHFSSFADVAARLAADAARAAHD